MTLLCLLDIRVSKETSEKSTSLGEFGETFSDIVERLADHPTHVLRLNPRTKKNRHRFSLISLISLKCAIIKSSGTRLSNSR